MDRHLRDLRTSKPLPGFDAVRLPGQERRARRADRLANGVPMPRELMAQLDELAGELGIKPLRGAASSVTSPFGTRAPAHARAAVAGAVRDDLARPARRPARR